VRITVLPTARDHFAPHATVFLDYSAMARALQLTEIVYASTHKKVICTNTKDHPPRSAAGGTAWAGVTDCTSIWCSVRYFPPAAHSTHAAGSLPRSCLNKPSERHAIDTINKVALECPHRCA
jgi:hypothetical protein